MMRRQHNTQGYLMLLMCKEQQHARQHVQTPRQMLTKGLEVGLLVLPSCCSIPQTLGVQPSLIQHVEPLSPAAGGGAS